MSRVYFANYQRTGELSNRADQSSASTQPCEVHQDCDENRTMRNAAEERTDLGRTYGDRIEK